MITLVPGASVTVFCTMESTVKLPASTTVAPLPVIEAIEWSPASISKVALFAMAEYSIWPVAFNAKTPSLISVSPVWLAL